MSDQVQRDDNGIYTLTAQAFEKEVDRFSGSWNTRIVALRFVVFLGHIHPTGWDITGNLLSA